MYVCTSCYTILDIGKKIVAFPELGYFTCRECYNRERVKFIINRFFLCRNIYSKYFVKDIHDVILSMILGVINYNECVFFPTDNNIYTPEKGPCLKKAGCAVFPSSDYYNRSTGIALFQWGDKILLYIKNVNNELEITLTHGNDPIYYKFDNPEDAYMMIKRLLDEYKNEFYIK